MEILVTYDVSTESAEGKRRLHRVAKACEAYGQRVQKSVFECQLDPASLEQLKHRLVKIIKESEDSLRFYRLQEPRHKHLQVFGRPLAYDLHEPLVM